MENELDNDIKYVMDQLDGSESVSDETPDETEGVTEETIEASSDEPREDETIESEETEETTDEILSAPVDWTAEHREKFNTLDRDLQEYLLERYSDMKADYTKKTTEASRASKNYESIAEVLEPIRNDYTSLGMDEVGAIRYLTNMYQQLSTDPEGTLRALAEQTGVDLFESNYDFDLDDDSETNYSDPRIDQLLKEREQEKRQAQQTQMQQLAKQVSEFETAKDEQGNLKHPFFNQVRQKMALIHQSGGADTLEEAYRMAVAGDPDLSAKQLQLIKESEAREQKKQAQRAKKAAAGVKGSSANNVDKQEPTGIREYLDYLAGQQ